MPTKDLSGAPPRDWSRIRMCECVKGFGFGRAKPDRHDNLVHSNQSICWGLVRAPWGRLQGQ